MSKITVNPAATDYHFTISAQLHIDGITEGFLSTLGISFLRTLYNGISAAQDSGVLVAEEDGEVLGFISFARDVGTCYKSVLKSKWPALTVAMIPNAIRPSFYKMVFETLSYPISHTRHEEPGKPISRDPLRPELLSMAVSRNARGKGIGKLLIRAVDHEMRHMNLPGYYVVTHSVDPRSNGFYLGQGFMDVRQYTNHGKPMTEYYKILQ